MKFEVYFLQNMFLYDVGNNCELMNYIVRIEISLMFKNKQYYLSESLGFNTSKEKSHLLI
jgi:hypothetical protein